MKILLINHYAGSLLHGMEYRPYYLAREWIKMGHSPTIAAGSISHVRNISPKIKGLITHEEIDGIPYIWLKTPLYSGNGIRRALNIFTFISMLTIKSWKIAQLVRPDVVIASSTYPLDILPAWHISKICNAKLVYEVHDLWPLSPIELSGMSSRHPFIMLMQFAENFAYRHADKVISMLPKVHEHMANHGLDLRKLHIIPNGISINDWEYDEQPINGELKNYIKESHQRGKLVIGYAGAHGLPNALDNLLDAAKLIKNENICFVIVGDGHEKKRLQERVDDEDINNVSMFKPISKHHIPFLLKEVDAMYIGLQKQPLFRFGVSPNKLMDYMMAGKPVIYAIEAGNDIVAESGCGISIPPEEPEAVVHAIKQLMGMSTVDLYLMGQRGKKYVINNYDYRVLAKRFLEVLYNVK